MYGLKIPTLKKKFNAVALLLKDIWTENGHFPMDASVIGKI